MADSVLAAQQLESIKEHITPGYTRERSVEVPSIEVLSVAGLLGVENPDAKVKEKLAFIKHQFESAGEADLLFQIRQIERTLTPPRIGENRVDILYNYLRARQEAKRSRAVMESYRDGEPDPID